MLRECRSARPMHGLALPFGDINSDVATEVLLNSLERINPRTVQRVVFMNKIIGDKYVSMSTSGNHTVTGASALPESHGHCLSCPSRSQHQLATGWVALSQSINSLQSFRKAAHPSDHAVLEEDGTSIICSGRAERTRGSFVSVFEMISTPLTVVPSRYKRHGPVPLRTSSSSISVSVCLIRTLLETER